MAIVTIVGFGQMGRYYLNNLQNIGLAEDNIVVCDIDPAKVARAQNDFPALAIAGTLDALPVTETAIIASNTPSHCVAIEALTVRGTRFIFCEKPLGLSLEETDRIDAAVRAVDGAVYTAFLINFSPAVQALIEQMRIEDLVLVEGMVTWGKNRFGDTRPSSGDTEDESVHGAELLRLLAGINREIHSETVSGRVSYLDFVDQAAQDRAHALDPSFPRTVDSSTFALLTMETNVGKVSCSLQSSFLLGEQVRQVRVLLASREKPEMPRYAARFDFDVKRESGIVDLLQVTDIQKKTDIGEQPWAGDKIKAQLLAFYEAIAGGKIDERLTSFLRAKAAVAFTKAIQQSSERGTPVSL
ncbi:MAG: Gfo/Idh/MocA family oxidoreductase [Candidatus Moraniibacteriota bacterium]